MIAYRCRILLTMDGTPIENGVFIVDGPRILEIGAAREILKDLRRKQTVPESWGDD